MKNKKIMLVFILIIAYLFIMIVGVKATNPLPIIDSNNEQNQGVNDTNTEPTNTQPTPTQPTPSQTGNSNGNSAQTNSLPDTGVAEDTALFVFITVCVASSIYAFVKIRNYKNV